MTPALGSRVSIGPTWETNPDGSWHLPERTLGWQVIDWVDEYLRQPDGPDAGDPWAYTPEQLRFVLWWYAVNERGRFIYRRGMLRRIKGWGKDPLVATLAAVEFAGPCRFDGFDAAGEPVAIAHPAAWVVIAAVSKDQTRNTMSLFPALLSDELIAEQSIDVGKEIIYGRGGRTRIEAVTSSPRALEGPRTTFGIKNETQHWLKNNDGHEMAKVMARNVRKARGGGARLLAISNAHRPGEDSDAERAYNTHLKILEKRTRATGVLYDSLEAPPGVDLTDEQQLRAGLIAARGDSDWIPLEETIEEIYDPETDPSDARRFYLNQLTAAEDAWIQPHEWDRLAVDGIVVDDGEDITLGLDPSKSNDHTSLMACRVDDGYTWCLGVWVPEQYGGEVPRELIDQTVRGAAERWRVLGFFSDLHPFESYVDAWARDLPHLIVKATPKHAVAWDMRTRTKDSTAMYERLKSDILEMRLRHDGTPAVKTHFHNARRRPNAWGVSVGKEHRESPDKIDSVPSTGLAREARRQVLASDKRPRRKRTGKTMFA